MPTTEVTTDSPMPSQTIAPSGQTDDIRYILNTDNDKPDDKPGRPGVLPENPRGLDPQVPLPSDSSGLADQVIDDADTQLPDRGTSTIRGGQVARESKRGAY